MPALERPEVAIVIPAFNEAATIARVVSRILLCGQPIVVDDCSEDETASLARAAGAVVVSHDRNRGYDAALNSGFGEADRRGFSYVVTFDADGQHDATVVEGFVERLKQGSDLVVGVRPRYQRLAEGLFALYTRMRFGLLDPLCGMKGYRMSLYHERGWFDSYQSIGTELALYGLRRKKQFEQVTIPLSERVGAARFAKLWGGEYRILRALVLSWVRS